MELTSQERLELFIERAREILSYSFIREIQQEEALNIHLSQKIGESLQINYIEPSREVYAAFILLLRSFIEKRDGISLLTIRTADIAPGAIEPLLNDSSVSDQWKTAFRNMRSVIDPLLMETPPNLQFPDTPTRKVLLETFVYGDFSHFNRDKRAKLREWQAAPFIYTFYKQEFAAILAELLGAIEFMLHWSEQELKAGTSDA